MIVVGGVWLLLVVVLCWWLLVVIGCWWLSVVVGFVLGGGFFCDILDLSGSLGSLLGGLGASWWILWGSWVALGRS